MRFGFSVTLLLLVCATGCHHVNQDKDAVRAGVVDYAKNKAMLDMSHIDVQVNSVNFHDNEATAVVGFRDTSSAQGDAMQWTYNLENKDGKWVVKGKGTPVGGHGGMGGTPPPSGQLPPGHPEVTPESGPSHAPKM